MKKLLTSFSLIDCSRNSCQFRKLSVPSHIESGRNRVKERFSHPTTPLKFSMKDSLSSSPLLQDETMTTPSHRTLFICFRNKVQSQWVKYKGKIHFYAGFHGQEAMGFYVRLWDVNDASTIINGPPGGEMIKWEL